MQEHTFFKVKDKHNFFFLRNFLFSCLGFFKGRAVCLFHISLLEDKGDG
ncbi:unnamed protein product, partial [Vitis vinifera]